MDALSQRGSKLVEHHPFPEYLQAHFERAASLYDATDDPDGYISMAIAENRLVWDLLAPRLRAPRPVPHEAICYDAMTGAQYFKERLASFLGARILGRTIAPETVSVLAGAGSVLEVLFYVIADPGDGVLVPTPSYAGFWADLETRDQLKIVPVNCLAEDGFALTRERLDAAWRQADRPIRALLFTSPNNPLGRVYSRAEVEEVIAWTEEKGIHLVCDEIYALSVFGASFVSGASLRSTLGERTHVVWAFSKDFGASGLRCGVLVSENEAVNRAVDALAYWSCCSGDTQFLLSEMLADDAWVAAYVSGMQKRLGDAYTSCTEGLRAARIPFFAASAGFFLLCDLRGFLAAQTWEAEAALWRRILDEANVNFTPGSACHCAEPGLMRLCYAGEPETTIRAGLDRVAEVLR